MPTLENQNIHITQDQNRTFWSGQLTNFIDNIKIEQLTVTNVKELVSSGIHSKTIGEIKIEGNIRLRVETYDSLNDIAFDTQWDVVKKI